MKTIRILTPVGWGVDGPGNCILKLPDGDYWVQEAQKLVPTDVWILFVQPESYNEAVLQIIIPETCMPEGMIDQLKEDYLTIDKSSRKYDKVWLEEPKTPSSILFNMIRSFNKKN